VVINQTESLWLGIAGLLLGALSGLVNGFVIARLKINALITTLATMQIVRGLAYIISDGKAVGLKMSVSLPSAMPTGLACRRRSG
jgi:L-arabinose transport system permease protein